MSTEPAPARLTLSQMAALLWKAWSTPQRLCGCKPVTRALLEASRREGREQQ